MKDARPTFDRNKPIPVPWWPVRSAWAVTALSLLSLAFAVAVAVLH